MSGLDGMTGSDPAPRSALEIASEVLWEHVQRNPPWEYVLDKAGWSHLDQDVWARHGSDETLTLMGRGWGSHVVGAKLPTGIWTCDEVWVHWLHAGERPAACRALAHAMLERDTDAVRAGLPSDLIESIRKELASLGLSLFSLGVTGGDVPDNVTDDTPPSGRAAQTSPMPALEPPPPQVPGVAPAAAERRSPSRPGCPPLDDILEFLRRYLVFQDASHYIALTLWTAHTYLIDEFDVTPRLAVLSPQPASGKTRVLDILEVLALNPVQTVNLTQAALFRTVTAKQGRLTLLLDEVDSLFGAGGSGDSDQIKSILNGGYRRGSTVMRAGSQQGGFKPERFEVFAPVAMAGLGSLPDSLLSRCVVLPMRKRRGDEPVQRYRLRDVREETAMLRGQLAAWAQQVRGKLNTPVLPEDLSDRAAEIWEPLLAVADAASPDWFEAAAVAAVAAVAAPGAQPSSQTKLLSAVKDAFDESGKPRLRTKHLLEFLERHDAAQPEYRGAQALAATLSAYGIYPKSRRDGSKVHRGYERTDFEDAWSRYLP